MIVLGVDPGAPAKPTPGNRAPVALHGWCLLDVQPGERPVWVDAGHDTTDFVLSRMRDTAPGAVVIERPSRAHTVEVNMPLLATAFAAGEFYGRALEQGRTAAVLTAEDWRVCVAGSRSPSDAVVKVAVGRLVALPRQTNAHERDAAGVALGWALRSGLLVGGRGRLTPPAASAR